MSKIAIAEVPLVEAVKTITGTPVRIIGVHETIAFANSSFITQNLSFICLSCRRNTTDMKKQYGLLAFILLITSINISLLAQQTPQREPGRNNRRADSLSRQDSPRRAGNEQRRQSDSLSDRNDGVFWRSDSSRRRDSSFRRYDSS